MIADVLPPRGGGRHKEGIVEFQIKKRKLHVDKCVCGESHTRAIKFTQLLMRLS